MDTTERINYLFVEIENLQKKISYIENDISKNTKDYEDEAKISSKKATEYLELGKKASEEILDKLSFLNEKTGEFESKYQTIISEINNLTELVEFSKDRLDLIDSTKENALKIHSEFKSEIETFNLLLEKKTELEENLKKLNEIFKNADEFDSKFNVLNKSITDRKKEIDELYFDIVGFTEYDDLNREVRVPGKKDDLELAYNLIKAKVDEVSKDVSIFKDTTQAEYSKNIKEWEEYYTIIKDRIESLLPNAMTAGLSSAYSEKKQSEIEESIKNRKNFIYAIWGLIAISLIPVLVSIVSLSNDIPLETVILRVPRIVLAIFPLYVPVLWVAYSANKKVNLSKRLIEEYSHKEVLSKTFEGLSTQIKNIQDKDISEDLRTKLLYNILEVNSENPGKLISDYNKTDHPLMDALDKSVKLTNAITKLSKIPGFNKLASNLSRKAEAVLNTEAKKAEAGIESVSE